MAEDAHTLQVQLLRAGAIIPKRGTPGSAGYDLSADTDGTTVEIPPGTQYLFNTAIAIALPKGTYGQIASRSSLAVKGLHVGAGVIDEDYRGEIKVLLCNTGTKTRKITQNQKIAQLIIHPYLKPGVFLTQELPPSQRGEAGFGSTGK